MSGLSLDLATVADGLRTGFVEMNFWCMRWPVWADTGMWGSKRQSSQWGSSSLLIVGQLAWHLAQRL